MLYDKRWDRQVTGLPLWSIEDFTAFLETKDPNETFDFTEARTCAVAQYLQARGVENYVLGPDEIPWPIKAIVMFDGTGTFGAALVNARWSQASRWERVKMFFSGQHPDSYSRWRISHAGRR